MQSRVSLAVLLILLCASNAFSFMLSSRSAAVVKRGVSTRKRSMSSTVEQVAHRLVNSTDSNNKALVCIAVAGGGSHAISALASTPGASSMLLEGTVTYDRRSFHKYVQHHCDDQFNYVSSEAAHLLSQTALERAMQYRSSCLGEQTRCVGVGSSSALVQSKPGRLSRAHVVATRADGRQWECYLQLAPNNKTRVEQDQLLGRILLESIEQVNIDEDERRPLVRVEDEDEFQQWHSPGVPPHDAVRVGAERVLLGETPAVVLLPSPCANKKSFMAVPHVVLPNRAMVFPGSFNPPHIGHVALANAAKNAFRANTNEDPAVFFEISLINADKPAMDAATVSERAHKIFDLENLPSNWGVLLTSVPLFSEKADVLRDCIAADVGIRRQMAFVIGTDTMVRILNPKYYGDSTEAMLEAVRDMKRQGVHFVVGGRLQQGTETDTTFVTGEEELADLPGDVQAMFTLVKEEDFRVDLSSTELRKQAEKDKLGAPP